MIIHGQPTDGSKAVPIPIAADGQSIPVSGAAQQGAAGVHADAEATPSLGGLFSFLKAYNGATWDYIRSGLTAVSSVFTGKLNTLPWGIYHATPTVRADGQGGPVEAMTDGSVRVTEQLASGYEDQINGLALVEERYSFLNITTATTTTVKNGAGFLHLLVVGTPVASATIQLYDNTTNSGTKIGLITLGATLTSDPPGSFRYDVVFSTGLTIVTTQATDITVSYR